jgi:hypothetical protein
MQLKPIDQQVMAVVGASSRRCFPRSTSQRSSPMPSYMRLNIRQQRSSSAGLVSC